MVPMFMKQLSYMYIVYFIRSYVLSQQDAIMNASYVSMVGNPNSTSLDDYIQVFR